MAKHYAHIDETGRVVGVSHLNSAVDRPEMFAIEPGADVLGKRWNGETFEDVEPEPGRTYSQIQFLDAIGDEAALQFLTARANDPVIELIDRKFTAASFIDTEHPATAQALDYLVASELVPAFTQSLVDQLRGIA